MTRPFDIIVYGATGFTGKRVAKYLAQSHPEIKFAISGRNSAKLASVASELGLPADHALTASIDADEQSKRILESTLSKAKIVLACAGPYRHCGEPIVEAAIAAGTDYLDLCGEPQFFDDMLAKYDKTAREKSTIVLSACAFDCVPGELTAQLAKMECKKLFPSSPVTNIEIVHTFRGESTVNATTFHAAVDGFHSSLSGELKAARDKVKGALYCPPKLRDAPRNGPTLCLHQESHLFITKRLVLAYGAVFVTLARFDWGCKLLHGNPEFFTNGYFTERGPSEEELKAASFKTYCTAYGKDKDEFVKVTCEGPEPGYVATPQILVGVALMVLNHRDKMRYQGGVMVPGVAFGECNEAYEILRKEGIDINIVGNGVASKSND